jgi:hypothetical protein
MFVGAMAGVAAPREHLMLEAIAAERLPQRMVVWGVQRAAFFELRDYGRPEARAARILNRSRVRVVWNDGGRFLFAFDSLAQRERAWREVSADAEWISIVRGLELRELALFQTASS